MASKLPPESYVALAAVAWADGRMSKNEAQGLLHAAKTLGLDEVELAVVEKATKEKVELSAFDAEKLSAWQRLFTYGIASWLSRLDGVQNAEELDSLRDLAGKLASTDITDFKLRSAAAVAFDVAMMPEGRRPDRYDFGALEAKLKERLPTVKE
jgi:hypothetical protein